MSRVRRLARVGALAAIALFILTGCNSDSDSGQSVKQKKAPEPQKPVVSEAARQTAIDIFDTRCAACHGATGRGDGAAAAALNPKPQDYHDMDWQKSVTDEMISKAIVYGGAAVGKSPIMVANPDLQSKPDVVQALVERVRSFGGK